VADANVAFGRTAWRRSRWSDQSRSETPIRSGDGAAPRPRSTRPATERGGALRLLPGRDRDVDPAAGCRRRLLEERHDERRRPGLAPDDEHREPLALVGVVAGEIAEVRADADQQRVEAAARGGTRRCRESRLEPLSGNRRPRRDRHGARAAVGAGRPSHVEIVAGPSSNSLR
jgi:hypothetical protein